MDEGNQMYIVQHVDEAKRKVEFVVVPIEPVDFAFHYGKEKMNKFAKQEMRDRLERSLAEKGMTLDQSPPVH
jgi:recombinational DNA repair protein (RecF pathway)